MLHCRQHQMTKVRKGAAGAQGCRQASDNGKVRRPLVVLHCRQHQMTRRRIFNITAFRCSTHVPVVNLGKGVPFLKGPNPRPGRPLYPCSLQVPGAARRECCSTASRQIMAR